MMMTDSTFLREAFPLAGAYVNGKLEPLGVNTMVGRHPVPLSTFLRQDLLNVIVEFEFIFSMTAAEYPTIGTLDALPWQHSSMMLTAWKEDKRNHREILTVEVAARILTGKAGGAAGDDTPANPLPMESYANLLNVTWRNFRADKKRLPRSPATAGAAKKHCLSSSQSSSSSNGSPTVITINDGPEAEPAARPPSTAGSSRADVSQTTSCAATFSPTPSASSSSEEELVDEQLANTTEDTSAERPQLPSMPQFVVQNGADDLHLILTNDAEAQETSPLSPATREE